MGACALGDPSGTVRYENVLFGACAHGDPSGTDPSCVVRRARIRRGAPSETTRRATRNAFS